MHILITGGAGFIGSNLSLKLIDKGYDISVLDNLSPQVHGLEPELKSPLYNSIKNKVNFIKGSVTDKNLLSKAIKQSDIIVHLAAETGTGQSMYQIKHYTDVNIGGTALLLDLLTNCSHNVVKVVIASSRAIYGEGKYECQEHRDVYPTGRLDSDMLNGDFECKCPICYQNVDLLPTSEDSKIHPSSVYGITKQNQEQMVLTVCKSIGISAIAFRYQNVYGPGQSLSNPYTGILSIFSTQIKNNRDINLFEDGLESRDFVYIDDVVNATILGIEDINEKNQVFNVGSGSAINVSKIAEMLIDSYNSNVKTLISGNYRLGDIRHNYADLSKIREKLGFIPKIDINEGIKIFCKWVELQHVNIDAYDTSIKELKLRGLFK